MKYAVITILSLSSALSFAATGTCKDIKSCVDLVSKLTNTKYIMDKDIKGTVSLTDNFTVTKENADRFISYTLYMAGYTRLPISKDEWSIINARDIRYQAGPSYKYPQGNVPDTYDYITASIKLKNPHLASELSRNFRPFMSRYGRVIDIKNPGMLIISDTGKNINRLISLVNEVDHTPTKEQLEKIEDDLKHSHKLELIKAKNCSHLVVEQKEVTAKAHVFKK